MPYRRRSYSKTRKPYRKRTYRRRTTLRRRPMRKSTRTSVRIPNKIMPDYTLVKMSDEQIIVTPNGNTPLTVGARSYVDIFITANDLYDAWTAVTGADTTQPTGFDQWMSFYIRFLVHKSSIKVTPVFWNTTGTAAQMPFQITIVPIAAATLTSATADFSEQPYARYKQYNAQMSTRTATALTLADAGQQWIPSTWNSMMMKKIAGVKDLVDNPDFSGTFTSSPNDTILWAIEIKSLVPAAATTTAFALSSMGLRIELFSKVQLLDRLTVPRSEA